jgi:hypothetical protein
MASLTSTLNDKPLPDRSWEAKAIDSDRILLWFEDEDGFRATLNLHRGDAEDIHDKLGDAIKDAAGKQ